IDYALCMYCGICVEVCPFDALFWAPDFEYAEYDILEMTHEKERLEEWTYKVLPPPMLEVGAELPPEEPTEEAPTAPAVVAPTPASPDAPRGAPGGSTPAPSAAAQAPAPAAGSGEAGGTPAASGGTPTSAAAVAPGSTGHVEVEPDQETFDRVLAEEL